MAYKLHKWENPNGAVGNIFLDELDPKAKGRPMKNMNFDCGIFCEERETLNKGE